MLFVGLLLAGCKGGDEKASTELRPAERSFDSFAAFLEAQKLLASDGAAGNDASTSSHQVVFIGIDGATWRFLDRQISEGKLPNFSRLKKEGSYGVLRSTPCYMSPPAWASMLSGYSPAKTGVYTFGVWNASGGEFRPVTAADLRVPSAWDVASYAGKKVAVTNVPLTYPVHPINGIMVSGLLTPVPMEPPMSVDHTNYTTGLNLAQVVPGLRSFSQPMKAEASDSLNTAVWWRVDSTNDGTVNYDRVVLTVLPRFGEELPDATTQVLAFDIGEYSPWLAVKVKWEGQIRDGWCKFKVFRRPDGKFEVNLSQILLDPREAVAQYTYPAELADELSSRFGYYMPTKFLGKKVVPAVTEETARYASYFYDYDDWDLFYYVFTQTDNIQHLVGFSELTSEVYSVIDRFLGELMARMPEESTLIIASDHGFKKFVWGIDLNSFFEQLGILVREPDKGEIDYDKTMVFHNMWYLYFNREIITRENLEAVGVPMEPSEDPVDALVKHIKNHGVATRNPDRQFPVEYYPAIGDFVGDKPDMLVEGAYDDYTVEFWNLKRPHDQMAFKLIETEAHRHERDGMFIVWGKHVRPGYDAGVREIEDITPTLLYLLGLPAAADMDGRVMYEVFREGYVKAQESLLVKDYSDVPRATVAVDDDKESLEKKLRSLGYVK
jgi:predicted AlkP superfamily phosphohydrolase/phosphomutase